MEFIDIHSHILPGIDDGACDEKEALEMLKIAASSGIRKIIATPHFHDLRSHATSKEIRKAVSKMQELLKEAKIPIQLYAGNELYYTYELLEYVKAGEALTLADSDYVLLEFSPGAQRRKIQNAVYEIFNEGYYPIIAHMERCQAFQKHEDFVQTISEMGAYFQINAGSLMGDAGWGIKRFSRTMVKNDMIHFIATDAHNTDRRRPSFGKTAKWLRKKYGEEQLSDYLCGNPKMIIENKVL